jgi:hypothetical protein
VEKINGLNNHLNLFHSSAHDYFVLGEVDRLTIGAQQSLRSPIGLKSTSLPAKQLQQLAANARGSMRDYMNDVVLEAIRCGGVMPQQ